MGMGENVRLKINQLAVKASDTRKPRIREFNGHLLDINLERKGIHSRKLSVRG